jgi:predicted MPP superfamily phosphohydrolase
MPALRIIIFFTILVVIVSGLHAYVGWRLIKPSKLGARARKLLWLLLLVSNVSILLAFVVGRIIEPGLLSTLLNWTGFTALGGIGIFSALVLFRDVFLVGASVPVRDPGRREFLRGASSIAVLGVGGFIGVRAVVQAARPPVVEDVPVDFPGLPDALQGFRIAQISDTHLGPTLRRPFLEDVVARVNALEPDLVAFTGDLCDGYVENSRDHVEPLSDLRAKHGAFFVTGNHEYYWGVDAWVDHLRSLGLAVLVNEHRVVDAGGAKLAVAGVTDLSAGRMVPAHESDAQKALAGAEDADFKLLLAHQPKSLYGAQRAGVDLQLCGHTHGGQVFPMSLLVHLAHPIVAGLGQFGSTWVYVNRGTAYWGPPMRTFGAGEITVVELRRET